MKTSGTPGNGFRGMRLTICVLLTAMVIALPARAQTKNGTVLGWNNLGMHCADGDFSVLCLLPPYNTIHSQVIDATGHLITNQTGVSVTYQAVADPDGSINKSSIGKTNFWDYVQAMFGVPLQPDVGLPVPGPNSFSMPGSGNVPQTMSYEAAYDWLAAYGIPITATDDAGNVNTYPLMRLTGKSGSTTLATKDIVLPVSTEINCRACHGSGSDPNAQPADGWVNLPEVERDFRLNVLRLHDDRQLGTPAFAAALTKGNFDPAGLYATVIATNKPILCAACHVSEALPGSGQAGVPALTSAIHTLHGKVNDPANGMILDSANNRTSCYYCHPGKETKCLRGVMGRSVAANGQLAIQCQSCHGTMSQVGITTRTGWLDEPTCQSCHTGDAVANAGQIRYETVYASGTVVRNTTNQRFATSPNSPAAGYSLYRFSRGHGGLQCAACHNSTHAEFPSIDDNDNIASIQQQGYIGTIAECQSCHGTSPNTVNGGPHGLHPLGQTWVNGHEDSAGSACRVCHGTDYRGTVLSRMRTDRTLTAFGTKTFWRGFQVGCYNCHNGPGSDSANSNTPAVVRNLTASTTVGKAVPVTLQASDANNNALTLRVVSQPKNGTAGLSGTVITYFPDPGFVGSDMLTYAAWDGSTDSNLGTVTITVTGSGGGGGCAYTITPANATVGAGASSNTITVGTTAGCAWTAASNASWITITSGASGTGPGTVGYSVAANTGSSARSGTITVAGQSFTVNQGATSGACTYAITPTSTSVTSGSHTGTVSVTTTPGCAWKATSSAAWITITSGASGTGSGTVAYSIAANTGNSGRSGTIAIADRTFAVNQSGASCTYSISPTSASLGAAASTGAITVNTGAGCAWTVVDNISWLTVTSGANGTGPGTVTYSVTENTNSASRTGTLTVAGQTFTVTQVGGGCVFAINPISTRISARGGEGSVSVNTTPGCRWTAKSNVGWITITTGFTGNGKGSVSYRVSRNNTSRSRTGTMTIAGLTFTVSQSSGRFQEGSLGIRSEFGNVALDTKSNRQLLSAELIFQNDTKSPISKVQPAVYLSNDGVKDAADTLLWTRPIQSLAAGEDIARKFRITLPDGTIGKGKYLVAVNTGGSEKDAVVYGPIE